VNNLEQDIKKWQEERSRLATEFSGVRNDLSVALYRSTKKIIENFEKETGFAVAEVDVLMNRYPIMGKLRPEYSLANVQVKLDIEEQLS